MSRKPRILLIFLLLSIFLLSAQSAVQADAALVSLLLTQPCSGGWEIHTSYPPRAVCYGLDRTVSTTTLIPVPRAYNTAPQYPFVGLVTALGVDWDPASFGVSQSQTSIFLPEDDWFVNYRIELRVSSLQQNGGLFNIGAGTNRFYALRDQLPQVAWGYATTYPSVCPKYTLEHIPESQGGWGGCHSISTIESQLGNPFTVDDSSFYQMGGARPDWMWLGSQISSKGGSAQKYGEPAFGMEVTTHWTVWARSTWDHYYDWDCHDEVVINPVTGLPVLDPITGEPVTEEVCEWVDRGSGGGFVYLGPATLNYVVVPDQDVQPLYPVPVFQSQPLLTTR